MRKIGSKRIQKMTRQCFKERSLRCLQKNKLEHSEKWYKHAPEGAVENEEIKVLWDINVQCDNLIKARRPELIIIDKKEQKGIIIDIAVPTDVIVKEKQKETVES